jgi:signal transduction histidine kinase
LRSTPARRAPGPTTRSPTATAPAWGALAALAVAGAAASAVTAVVTAGGSATGNMALEVIGRVLIVAVPIAVGLFAWSRPASSRFGRNLTLIGFGWFVASLSTSSDPAVYSVGRIAGWMVEAAIIYLVLSFPSGRLAGSTDRALVAAALAVACVLYLPTALVVTEYPVPSQWASCSDSCPGNAFQLTASEPAFVEAWLRPLREVLTILLATAVAVRLAGRVTRASALMRRTLAPVLIVACARLGIFVTALVAREVDVASRLVVVAGWLVVLALPVLALAFLAGLLRWRLFVGSALGRLAGRVVADSSPGELRRELADAFEDPAIQILYWMPGGHWVDGEGKSVHAPTPGSEQMLTEIRNDGERVAALVHDKALAEEHAFLEAGAAYALATLENQRLAARTAALLREVDESRARIAATADAERRRIERDLHDGAQQRLVALRMRLQLASELVADGGPGAAEMVRDLGAEAEAALEETRTLARGVYPAPLVDFGLVHALQSAVRHAALPIAVVSAETRRYPPPIEATAYFCCLEAIQNAGKHADGASRVKVTVAEKAGELWLEVSDDGRGFDARAAPPGAGLLNMRDRARAAGGELTIQSAPGEGTQVMVTIPLPVVTGGQVEDRTTVSGRNGAGK